MLGRAPLYNTCAIKRVFKHQHLARYVHTFGSTESSERKVSESLIIFTVRMQKSNEGRIINTNSFNGLSGHMCQIWGFNTVLLDFLIFSGAGWWNEVSTVTHDRTVQTVGIHPACLSWGLRVALITPYHFKPYLVCKSETKLFLWFSFFQVQILAGIAWGER